MANIASAKKRVSVSAKKELQNKMLVSKLKTTLKKFDAAIVAGNLELSKKLLPETLGLIDSLAHKGILHKNNADRKKSAADSKFNRLVNAAKEATQEAVTN